MKQIFSFITAALAVTICHAQFANRKLSNLVSPTSVNVSLLPARRLKTIPDLGSDTTQWGNGYFNGTVYAYGANTGIGIKASGSNYGVYATGHIGLFGASNNVNGYGAVTFGGYVGTFGSGTHYGVYGSSSDTGVYGSGNFYGLYGTSKSVGVYGVAGNYPDLGTGVYGIGTGAGVYGSGVFYGVYGLGTAGTAGGTGVSGSSDTYIGVFGSSVGHIGVYGISKNYYAGFFAGDVYCTGSYLGSDKSLKQNIRDFTSAISIINKLHPAQYEFRQDGNYKLMNLPKGTHYGLIAQEVEQVLPNLVRETKFDTRMAQAPQKPSPDGKPASLPTRSTPSETIGFKALNYTELIPVLIKGMQELSQENAQLKSEVAELKQMVNQYIKSSGVASLSSATLGQNVPNPFAKTTIISYTLPPKFSTAQIIITDKSGKQLKQLNIAGSGNGTVNMDAATLSSGTYNYSLIIDGKVINTKQMLLGK